MLQIIKNVLSPEVLVEFDKILSEANFVNGGKTAGKIAKKVKNNLELDPKCPHKDLLNKAIMGAIMQSDEFKYGAIPLKISTPIFAKYLSGMTYGYHVDDPIMGVSPDQYRSDISLTLFLNSKTDYDGGELVIKTNFGTQEIKLDIGDMVVYPSSSLHKVNPVIKGERLVMITWAESMVKDPAKRQILFDLWRAKRSLVLNEFDNDVNLLNISYANLLRMWANL